MQGHSQTDSVDIWLIIFVRLITFFCVYVAVFYVPSAFNMCMGSREDVLNFYVFCYDLTFTRTYVTYTQTVGHVIALEGKQLRLPVIVWIKVLGSDDLNAVVKFDCSTPSTATRFESVIQRLLFCAWFFFTVPVLILRHIEPMFTINQLSSHYSSH